MSSQNTVLVTGGAGFIGSNFVLDWIAGTGEPVVNLDALTYAGNRENLASLEGDPRHHFIQGDILDRPLLEELWSRSYVRMPASTTLTARLGPLVAVTLKTFPRWRL